MEAPFELLTNRRRGDPYLRGLACDVVGSRIVCLSVCPSLPLLLVSIFCQHTNRPLRHPTCVASRTTLTLICNSALPDQRLYRRPSHSQLPVRRSMAIESTVCAALSLSRAAKMFTVPRGANAMPKQHGNIQECAVLAKLRQVFHLLIREQCLSVRGVHCATPVESEC